MPVTAQCLQIKDIAGVLRDAPAPLKHTFCWHCLPSAALRHSSHPSKPLHTPQWPLSNLANQAALEHNQTPQIISILYFYWKWHLNVLNCSSCCFCLTYKNGKQKGLVCTNSHIMLEFMFAQTSHSWSLRLPVNRMGRRNCCPSPSFSWRWSKQSIHIRQFSLSQCS